MMSFGQFSDDDDFDIDAPLVPDSQLQPPSSAVRFKPNPAPKQAPLSGGPKNVACPLCSRSFPQDEIERHAAQCIGNSEVKPVENNRNIGNKNDGGNKKDAAMGQCPICGKWMSAEAIQAHVEQELRDMEGDASDVNFNNNDILASEDDDYDDDHDDVHALEDIDENTQWQPHVIDVDADEDDEKWFEQNDDIVMDHTAAPRPSSPVIAPPPMRNALPPASKNGVPAWFKTGVYTPGESLIVPGESLSPLKNVVNLKTLQEQNALTPALARYFDQFPSETSGVQQLDQITIKAPRASQKSSSSGSTGKRKRWPPRYKKH